MTRFGAITNDSIVNGDAIDVSIVDAISGLLPGAENAAANSVTIQTAINNATRTGYQGSIGSGAARLTFPIGEYYLSEAITIASAFGLELVLPGKASRFIWSGGDYDDALFQFRDCRQCSLFGGYWSVAGGSSLRKFVDFSNVETAPAAMTPTFNRVGNLFLDGAGRVTNAIVFGGAVDFATSNNDFNQIDHCEITGYTGNGISLYGSQNYNNILINNRLIADASNDGYGIYAPPANGSFSLFGGGFYGHGKADFYLGRSYQPFSIEAINCEGSARLLEIGASTYISIKLSAVRWSDRALHADGRAITTPDSTGQIHLKIENSSIGEWFDANPPDLSLYVSPADLTNSTFILENVRIGSALADPFTGIDPTRSEGVWLWTQ